MSTGLSLRAKVIALFAGVAVSVGAWSYASEELTAQQTPTEPVAALQPEVPLSEPAFLAEGDVDLPDINVPAYESALFGMQEALQSIGDIFSHAVTLDMGSSSGSTQTSTRREMVRSVGGAKFVAVR